MQYAALEVTGCDLRAGKEEIKVIPYIPPHYHQIIRKPSDLMRELNFPDADRIARSFLTGPGYTAFAGNRIIFSAGVQIFWKGCGEAWTLMSELIHKYPLFVHKITKEMLYKIITENRLERVQMIVEADKIEHKRWAEKLGFEPEGEMRKYLGGRKFIRYARITEFNPGDRP
jgi:hypothetical protein